MKNTYKKQNGYNIEQILTTVASFLVKNLHTPSVYITFNAPNHLLRMKHILLIIVSLFFSFTTLSAQDFWKLIPFPDSLGIADIAFNSQGEIYIATQTDDDSINEGVLRSSDQGQTWHVLFNNSYFQVGPIAVNDSGHIYIGTHGQYGFWVSYDNGNSWSLIQHPALDALSTIKCISTDTVLVGAGNKSGGVLLMRTADRGITWDTLFWNINHTSETISDIAIAPDGTIYIGLMCFMPDMGGVYKSTDNGITWENVGFINNQVSNIEVNAEGDLYIGVFGSFTDLNGGLYVIRNGSATIDTCLYGPSINGLVVNSAGHIYVSIAWTTGVYISKDAGNTFYKESSGLPIGPMGRLYIDQDEYVYAKTDFPSSFLYRTVEPTYTAIDYNKKILKTSKLHFNPNPAAGITTGNLNIPESINGQYNLTISDVNSRIIANEKVIIRNNSFDFNTEWLCPGFYIITVISGNKLYQGKLIRK